MAVAGLCFHFHLRIHCHQVGQSEIYCRVFHLNFQRGRGVAPPLLVSQVGVEDTEPVLSRN